MLACGLYQLFIHDIGIISHNANGCKRPYRKRSISLCFNYLYSLFYKFPLFFLYLFLFSTLTTKILCFLLETV